MGYAIYLQEPLTGERVYFDEPHQIKGGTFAIGGTSEAWLSVTYNYSDHYCRVFGEEGIRTIYGMTGAEALPVIEEAASKLGDDVDEDYWKSTEGNAKKALLQLKAFAQMRPDAIFQGD